MTVRLPARLISYTDGKFEVFDTRNPTRRVDSFDIITYTWGEGVPPYDPGFPGVSWNVPIQPKKIEDIKRLIIKANIQYLWADCICINQEDHREKAVEIPKMYQYYKSARKCYILMDMDDFWAPQEIVEDLHFINHVISQMGGSALATEARLTQNVINRLTDWKNAKWNFPMEASLVRSAAIDMGVLNCYSTCIGRVRSLFDNEYFSRVWTFQEMLLGKNITMYGIHSKTLAIYPLGDLDTWMDLATDSNDKAWKLQSWIETSRVLKTASVNAILEIIDEDCLALDTLQSEPDFDFAFMRLLDSQKTVLSYADLSTEQVKGLNSARTDIISGGPSWWYENHKGVSNIFSAISITPRKCGQKVDIFRGLLGVFSGLFSAEEVDRELSGDDIEHISFAFFKQLSVKTGLAWTKLAISSGERGTYDWIPVAAKNSKLLSTDIFAAVVNLGRLNQKGLAKATAVTGLLGTPHKFMKIQINKDNRGFQFTFRGCNCGKKVKTGLFSSEPIPTYDQPRVIAGDETGRILVQCATVAGKLIDPGRDVIQYRRRLLRKLQPAWYRTDPNAKPKGWIDRCVSGTDWEDPNRVDFRVHNMSMNYKLEDMTGFGSRLENESTANLSCQIRMNCGCTINAPFSFVFEAITAVEGGSLGNREAMALEDDRIVMRDGLGLVQVGDIGTTFDLVSFGGSIDAYRSYASSCRSTKLHKGVIPKLPWPSGRALVREEFTHGLTDSIRDYGYVATGGSGNLLICRNNPMGQYKIIGVCIDENIANKKGVHSVTIR